VGLEISSGGINPSRFYIPDLTWVLHLWLIILSVEDDVLIDSEAFLVTDFMNLKIKPAQSFEDAHKDMVCMHVFIGMNTHACMRIYIYTVFLKKYENTIGYNLTNLELSHSF
jgi:hypothetical protein